MFVERTNGLPTMLSRRIRLPLSNLAIPCDRTGSSYRSDLGIVSPNDQTHIVVRNKFRRERQRVRKDLKNASENVYPLAIYFNAGPTTNRKSISSKQSNGRTCSLSRAGIILSWTCNTYNWFSRKRSSGSKSKDGFIRTRLKSRRDRPAFHTKCIFFLKTTEINFILCS